MMQVFENILKFPQILSDNFVKIATAFCFNVIL